MPLSRALHMSYTVRAATLAATSASISTPVTAVVVTFEAMVTPFSHSRIRTSTCERGSGWHIGISSAVRLAAIMPARRVTSERQTLDPGRLLAYAWCHSSGARNLLLSPGSEKKQIPHRLKPVRDGMTSECKHDRALT